jgi:hypothetical protein
MTFLLGALVGILVASSTRHPSGFVPVETIRRFAEALTILETRNNRLKMQYDQIVNGTAPDFERLIEATDDFSEALAETTRAATSFLEKQKRS